MITMYDKNEENKIFISNDRVHCKLGIREEKIKNQTSDISLVYLDKSLLKEFIRILEEQYNNLI